MYSLDLTRGASSVRSSSSAALSSETLSAWLIPRFMALGMVAAAAEAAANAAAAASLAATAPMAKPFDIFGSFFSTRPPGRSIVSASSQTVEKLVFFLFRSMSCLSTVRLIGLGKKPSMSQFRHNWLGGMGGFISILEARG